jgi:hypothetical protein
VRYARIQRAQQQLVRSDEDTWVLSDERVVVFEFESRTAEEYAREASRRLAFRSRAVATGLREPDSYSAAR